MFSARASRGFRAWPALHVSQPLAGFRALGRTQPPSQPPSQPEPLPASLRPFCQRRDGLGCTVLLQASSGFVYIVYRFTGVCRRPYSPPPKQESGTLGAPRSTGFLCLAVSRVFFRDARRSMRRPGLPVAQKGLLNRLKFLTSDSGLQPKRSADGLLVDEVGHRWLLDPSPSALNPQSRKLLGRRLATCFI